MAYQANRSTFMPRSQALARRLERRRAPAQVLKKRLALNEPTVMTAGGFLYEEGEGLEADEAAANAALLPRPLAALPGGGLGHGALASVRDQSQEVALQLVIEHQARRGARVPETPTLCAPRARRCAAARHRAPGAPRSARLHRACSCAGRCRARRAQAGRGRAAPGAGG